MIDILKADFFVATVKDSNNGGHKLYVVSARYEVSAERIVKNILGSLEGVELVPIKLPYENMEEIGILSEKNPYVFP